jgi:hypothetical protein
VGKYTGAETRIKSHLAADRRDTPPSCEDGLVLLRLLVISASPPPPVHSSVTFIGVALVATSVSWREHDAFTEEQGTFFGDPFVVLNDISVVHDATQSGRAVAAEALQLSGPLLLAAVMLKKSLTAPVLVEGPMSTVVSTKALRLTLDYFGFNPTYEASNFTRRFRRQQYVFNVSMLLFSVGPEFARKSDALGVFGLHPL